MRAPVPGSKCGLSLTHLCRDIGPTLDMTDKAAQAVVTLKGRDNFNSEYM
jgi:hypothetical protein